MRLSGHRSVEGAVLLAGGIISPTEQWNNLARLSVSHCDNGEDNRIRRHCNELAAGSEWRMKKKVAGLWIAFTFLRRRGTHALRIVAEDGVVI